MVERKHQQSKEGQSCLKEEAAWFKLARTLGSSHPAILPVCFTSPLEFLPGFPFLSLECNLSIADGYKSKLICLLVEHILDRGL